MSAANNSKGAGGSTVNSGTSQDNGQNQSGLYKLDDVNEDQISPKLDAKPSVKTPQKDRYVNLCFFYLFIVALLKKKLRVRNKHHPRRRRQGRIGIPHLQRTA